MTEQKGENIQVSQLEVGNLILAIDRLYGVGRWKRVSDLLHEEKLIPVPPTAALEIFKLKESERSTLLNDLDETKVVWCKILKDGNEYIMYQPKNCPILKPAVLYAILT
jgi:hypothetical protein